MIPCSKCGLKFQCICDKIPRLKSSLTLSLITHEKEFERETNTGKWLVNSLPDCQRYQWKRTEKIPDLIDRLEQPHQVPLLLFPNQTSQPLGLALKGAQECQLTPHFLLLDGTWQEAKKMERKSPWLDNIQRVSFCPSQSSHYQLRKNQQSDSLCTLEVAIELLSALKETENSKQLESFFHFMMNSYLADKSGHALKNKPLFK